MNAIFSVSLGDVADEVATDCAINRPAPIAPAAATADAPRNVRRLVRRLITHSSRKVGNSPTEYSPGLNSFGSFTTEARRHGGVPGPPRRIANQKERESEIGRAH